MKITIERAALVQAIAYYSEISKEIANTPDIDLTIPSKDVVYKNWSVYTDYSQVQVWINDELVFMLFKLYLNLARKFMPLYRAFISTSEYFQADVTDFAEAIMKEPEERE